MAQQQVFTGIEVDNMQWERSKKAGIFRAEITKSDIPINAKQ